MATLWQDIRYAIRMLLRTPGFTAVVVVILALGIGANTAVFSIVNGVLLRPLPFAHPERVVQILRQHRKTDRPDQYHSLADAFEIHRRNHVFAEVAAISLKYLVDISSDEPRGIGGASVPATFFELLGVQPLLGRGFRPEEQQPGKEHVVVLSHEYWTQQYGANPDILGRTITLREGTSSREGTTFREKTYTVIGVMPAGFWCLDHRSLWMPLVVTAGQAIENSPYDSYLIARLAPGIMLAQAQAEMDVIAGQLRQERPRTNGDLSFLLASPQERMVANVRHTLWILAGIVGSVLAIACANVASMLLARSLGRQREMAIRRTLGAQRLRLVRQYLTESLLLSLAGGLGGVLLTVCTLGPLKAALPYDVPRVSEVRIDARVLGFAMVVSLLVGTLVGLVPVLRHADMDTSRTLKRGRLSGGGGGILHRALPVGEMALSLMLLAGTGLLIRSFRGLTSVDLGFDPQHVLVAEAEPYGSLYPQPQVYFPALLERIRRLPGVQTAALGSLRLFGGRAQNSFRIPGRETPPDGESPSADVIHVDEDYFQTLRIPLRQGRFPTENDRADTEPAVVVNEAFARRHFPAASAVGQTIVCWDKAWQIVGIVADVRPNGFRSDSTATMYFPYRQIPGRLSVRLLVRTEGEPLSVLGSLRREILALSPRLPPAQIRTIEGMLSRRVAPLRFNMQVLSLFAGLGLILAAVGVYGLMAFFVSQRTHEIGIRMALGARRIDLLKSVLGQGFRLALVAIALGLAGAWALTRLLSSLLYGVSPTDPLTFAGVALLLAGVALLACYLPARRAARIDPMVALRYE
jgi:putative ABC transport system permease protein